ncbi:MAG: FlgD immunoglobulin-like domain containing protein [Spirochaetia bacterium]
MDGVTSARTLTVTTANAEFDNTVGAGNLIASVSVTAGTTQINTTAITNTGAGGQTYGGAVTLGANVVLTSANGNVLFSSTANGTVAGNQSLSIGAGTGTVTFSLAVGNLQSLSSLTVSSTSDFTNNGAITVAGAGPISITADAVSINAVIQTTSGPITIQPVTATETIGLSAPGALSIPASVLQNDLVTTGTVTIGLTTGTGSIAIGNSGTISGPALNYNLTIRSASGNLTFGFPAPGATLALVAGKNLMFSLGSGSITHAGSATVDITMGAPGTLAFNTTGAVGSPLPLSVPILATSTIGGAGTLNLTDTVSLNVSGIVTAPSTIQIALSAGQTLTVSAGTITNGGTAASMAFIADTMTLVGGTITAGSGAVNLTSAAPARQITLGNGGSFLGLSNAALSTISTTGTLTIGDTAHTGIITTDAPVAINPPSGPVVLQTSGGNITLGANSFSTQSNLTLSTTGSGATTGGVSGTGALSVGGGAGSLTVSASTGISLTNVANAANAVSLTNGPTSGNVQYKNNAAMTLLASNSAGNGTITVVNASGTLQTAGAITANGGGTAGISLQTAGLLTISNAMTTNGSGGVSLTGGGVTVGAVTVNGGSGPILVDGGGLALTLGTSTLTTTNNSATAVTLRNATTAALGDITASSGTVVLGTAALPVSGAISQTGVTTINAATLTVDSSAVVMVTLTNANSIANLGTVTHGGAFSLTDSASLTVVGAVGSGGASDSVTINTTGATSLTVNAAIGASAGGISLTSGSAGLTVAAGPLVIGGGSGTILVDGGGGPLQFNTSTLSTSNATATAVTIRNGTTAALGNVTATSGTLNLGVAGSTLSGAITDNAATNLNVLNLSIAGGTYTIPTGYNLAGTLTVVSGTITAGGPITIANISILAGGTLSSANQIITVGVSWSNSGTFNQGTGTVTFHNATAGSTFTVSGTTTFYNFSCTAADAGATILFQPGMTQSIAPSGNFGITGTAGNYITLNTNPAGGPTHWMLALSSTATVAPPTAYVDVYWCDASANPLIVPANVNAGTGNPYNDIGWLFIINITGSATADLNYNGKLDTIIASTAPIVLNDNFGDIKVTVTGPGGVNYPVIGIDDPTPGAPHTYFYIHLQEQNFLDTGATLTWKITQNSLLRDKATNNALVVIPPSITYPTVTTNATDGAPPIIGYTLAEIGNNQIFVQFSEPVFGSGPGGSLAPADFTTFTTGVLPAMAVNTVTPLGNGRFVLAVNRNITAEDLLLPVTMTVAQTVKDAAGNTILPVPVVASPAPETHRISDLGLGQLTDGLFEPVWAHDETITGTSPTGIGLIQVGGFDGSKWLRAHQNLTVEGHIHTVTTATYAGPTPYPAAGTASLWYDINVTTTLRTSGGLWLPPFTDNVTTPGGFSGLVPTGAGGNGAATNVSESSSVSAQLRDFKIPGSDSRLTDNGVLDFIFRIPTAAGPNLYTARVVNPAAADWYNHITPWTFDLHDIRTQRGGATILNNVIRPEKGDLATLQYNQPSSGPVTIMVFDLSGSIVNVLTRVSSQAAGDYAVSWDGKNRGGRIVARGIYFVRIVAPGLDETRKVLVVR